MFDGIESADYGGREFRFLMRELNQGDFYVGKQTGDVYSDSVWRRNLAVETEFSVKLVPIVDAGEWNDRDPYMNRIRSSVLSGSGDYDLIEMYAAFVGYGVTDGLLLNLNEVEHLRLDSPWWSKRIREEMAVNGRLYAAAGDIGVSLWNEMHVFFYNKKLALDYGKPSFYEMVIVDCKTSFYNRYSRLSWLTKFILSAIPISARGLAPARLRGVFMSAKPT